MLNLILAVTLLVAPPLQDDTPPVDSPPGPDPAEVEEAIANLEKAFRKGKTPDRLEALQKYGKVNDGEVIDWIARGLKDKEKTVRTASIESLRWLEHPDALDALHTSYKKDRTIKKDDQLHELMIKAIGQHGHVSSIEILTDNSLAEAPRKVHIARIYSLGNIRDAESVEVLMDYMQRTGRGRRGAQPLMNEFRNALRVLTGEDCGRDEKAWADWWKQNEKDFEMSAEPTGLSRKEQAVWNKYWGLEDDKKKEREKRRKKGGDDEGGA